MIRFIIIIILMVLFFIASIGIWIVEWIIGKFNRRAKDISCLRIVQWAFRVVQFVSGTKTTVIGLENIPKDEPVLFVGNHQSFFDIIISYSLMPNLTGYVSKKEIKKVPFLSTWMQRLYCLFLDRKDVKAGFKTILEGIDLIKNKGISIAIFPEGTRSKDGNMLPFKEGSFKFAEKSGCKIIPIAQNNTSAIWEDQFPRIRPAKTVIEFGAPIDLKELSPEDRKFIGAYTQKIIQEMKDRNEKLITG